MWWHKKGLMGGHSTEIQIFHGKYDEMIKTWKKLRIKMSMTL